MYYESIQQQLLGILVEGDLNNGSYETVKAFMEIFNENTETPTDEVIFDTEKDGFVQVDVGNYLTGTIHRVSLHNYMYGGDKSINISIWKVDGNGYPISNCWEMSSYKSNAGRSTTINGLIHDGIDGSYIECTSEEFIRKIDEVLADTKLGTINLVVSSARDNHQK